VITALIGWRDPHTNKRRVHAAYRREEVYRGRYLDAAPDVTIEWDPEAAPPADQLEGNTSRFEGDHSPDGIFIASGSAVRNRTRIHGVSIADVAPTILHWLGVPITEPMDGRVLTELFQSSEEASSCGIKRSCDGGGLSIPDDTRV
jgi:predicted AlkP superfamily phosphohydrolase/phosphomutase